MEIITLGLEHEAALFDFLADFDKAGENEIPAYFPSRDWPHSKVVEALDGWSRGEGLKEGWVPCTTSFLWDGESLLGVVNLRHSLNKDLLEFGGNVGYSVRPSFRRQGHGTRLLAAAIDQARELGLDRILVTSDPANKASIKVIERNNGVFYDEYFNEKFGEMARRYWISLLQGRSKQGL